MLLNKGNPMKNITIIKLFLIISTTLILNNCGFQKINKDLSPIVNIEKFNLSGDSKINYNLKNEILLTSKKKGKNRIIITLKTEKKKTDKVKETSGKITRYMVSINVNMTVEEVISSKTISKSFSKSGDISVGRNHSDTIDAEKKMVKNLSEILAKDIIRYVNIYFQNK